VRIDRIDYVGLCTAVGFASKGYTVIASTHDAEKAAKINKGIPPFYEPFKKHNPLPESILMDVFNSHGCPLKS